MTPTAEQPSVQHATEELVALALAARPDWPERDVRGALAHASQVGITWPQALVALPRLMADLAAQPTDLVPDSRDPLTPRRPRAQDPHAHAAAVRAALNQESR